MRRTVLSFAVIASAGFLTACDNASKNTTNKRVVGVVDETNLNDIMLTVADPNEAVGYFREAISKDPSRLDLQRGLAKSLVRANRPLEAMPVFETILKNKKSVDQDRIDYAGAMIRVSNWDGAAKQLNMVPPTVETYERYRFEAMIADSQKKWKKADSFYETAAGLTTQPAGVLNNWGYSKLTRGEAKNSEKLFLEAVTYNPKLFHSKKQLGLGPRQPPGIPVTHHSND